MRIVALAALLTTVAACSAPPVTAPPYGSFRLDPGTTYSVDRRDDGFFITVTHRLAQFIPDTAAIERSCRAALSAAAREYADRRPIEAIDEQRIKVMTGRDGGAGISSCVASTPVYWMPGAKQARPAS